MLNRREFLKSSVAASALASMPFSASNSYVLEDGTRPNILFCVSDDQSWLHTGAYGCKAVETPNFDSLAKNGVLFNNAYCASPSCTPSRGGILSGQAIWRLGPGGNLWSSLPKRIPLYTEILGDEGYFVGFTGKGWGPGRLGPADRDINPAGRAYNNLIDENTPRGMNPHDYAANFEQFMSDKPKDKPFCFWYGCHEPHRIYKRGIGIEHGMSPEKVEVPPVWPDVPEVRSDILDYLFEVQHYDKHLGRMLTLLEKRGELENTIVVVTSDNGMPFPRAKANLYDLGTRMPLVIAWKGRLSGGRTVNDMVSLTDLAPTFLEAAGVKVPDQVTGSSLMPVLTSEKSGRVQKDRDAVFFGRERHAYVRKNNVGYPSRAIRTHDFLYIRNYEPGRWPAGHPNLPEIRMGVYGDIDNGPTKTYMLEHKDDPKVAHMVELAGGKRPAEELYDISKDPWQINNVADAPEYASRKKELSDRLTKYLAQTGDPRETDAKVQYDDYPYYG